MKIKQYQVKQFMQAAGQDCPDKPVIPNAEVTTLRYRLIQEELDEYSEAVHNNDVVGVADAIGDLLVVVLGAAVAHGIDIEPIFNEIHRSNMTKFIDGHRREDGKWIKGPSYTPADLEPILKAQVQP